MKMLLNWSNLPWEKIRANQVLRIRDKQVPKLKVELEEEKLLKVEMKVKKVKKGTKS